MKRIFAWITSLVIICSCGITVNAADTTGLQCVSTPLDIRSTANNQGVPIAEFIETSKGMEKLQHDLELLQVPNLTPGIDSCRWVESQYILKYYITLNELLQLLEGVPISEILENNQGSVITPIYTTIDGVERIGGVLQIHAGPDGMPSDTDCYIHDLWAFGEVESLFETIDAFNGYARVRDHFPGITIYKMILLEIPQLASNPIQNTILLLETDNGIQILDITNAAHNSEAEPIYGHPKTRVYSLATFIEFRTAYERIESQNTLLGAMDGIQRFFLLLLPKGIIIPAICIISVLVLAVFISLMLWNQHKKKRKRDSHTST